jgi:single-strand DNA-binding protein
MRGVNKVILVGNATRDAELRHTQTGKAVSSIRLATNRSIKGEEETQFHSIVCWDRLAETTAEYVKKGDPLYVEGRLQYRRYQDEEGKERGSCEIVADDVQFLARRTNGNRGETED